MKFAMFFLLCCVAFVAAAPQYFTTYPGFAGPALGPWGTRTLVTGPTVYNGALPAWGGRLLNPGYFGGNYNLY